MLQPNNTSELVFRLKAGMTSAGRTCASSGRGGSWTTLRRCWRNSARNQLTLISHGPAFGWPSPVERFRSRPCSSTSDECPGWATSMLMRRCFARAFDLTRQPMLFRMPHCGDSIGRAAKCLSSESQTGEQASRTMWMGKADPVRNKRTSWSFDGRESLVTRAARPLSGAWWADEEPTFVRSANQNRGIDFRRTIRPRRCGLPTTPRSQSVAGTAASPSTVQ